MHLRRNRFGLHVSPPQQSTATAPILKVMAGTRRKTVTSRSATSQAPCSTIQILQSRTVLILEPVNPEGSDAILDTATGVRAATTALDATALPPPLSQTEDAPLLSPQAPPPLETNVLFFKQQWKNGNIYL